MTLNVPTMKKGAYLKKWPPNVGRPKEVEANELLQYKFFSSECSKDDIDNDVIHFVELLLNPCG